MEGKFVFKSEEKKKAFIRDKERDINKYKHLIKQAQKLIDEVEQKD